MGGLTGKEAVWYHDKQVMKEMRDTVKALVWIGCLIGVTVLNGLLGEVIGFRLGYVPVFLIVSGLSTAICKGMGYDEKEPQETP